VKNLFAWPINFSKLWVSPMLEFGAGIPKPTQVEYHLSCVVKVFDITYEDVQGRDLAAEVRTMVTEKMVFLFPRSSTQCDLFFAAWMPDVADESVEIGLRAGHPVSGFIRASLFRAQLNGQNDTPKKRGLLSKFFWSNRDGYTLGQPHIFVQTKAVEEILKHMDGKTLNLTVLPEDADTLLDQQQDFSLSTQR